MSELDYGVSYIASAPEELKVGDRVVIETNVEAVGKNAIGFIRCLNAEGKTALVSIIQGVSQVAATVPTKHIRKLHDTNSFEEDSDNVKAFNAILNEMAETYKAKNETYGDCYQDGFNRFGAVQLVSRMYEKYCRIENLLVRNADNKVPDESVIDTITDLGVQCIVLRMLLQRNDFESVK